MIYETIKSCRLCGNAEQLSEHLDLGFQPLSGTFPLPGEEVICGPLRLLICQDCGLVQLGENYDPELLYGENYGYRSGLNPAMVKHLDDVARHCERVASLRPGDVVLDIGSNDGTLLGRYQVEGLARIGIDPTSGKFAEFYNENIVRIETFFNSESINHIDWLAPKQARVVTSIACFYDLQKPLEFAFDVRDVLAEDGIWVSEQAYFPNVLAAHAYDGICHEHLEYYRLADFAFICRMAGLQILDVQFNDVNGGSFMVTMCRDGAPYVGNPGNVEAALAAESAMSSTFQIAELREFLPRHRDQIRHVLTRLANDGVAAYGYGASTKGNVLLNYCGITPELLPLILDVNPDKFGRVTPGSGIPIVDEAAAIDHTNHLFVLIWAFGPQIIRKQLPFLERGGKLIFPLPELDIVG